MLLNKKRLNVCLDGTLRLSSGLFVVITSLRACWGNGLRVFGHALGDMASLLHSLRDCGCRCVGICFGVLPPD